MATCPICGEKVGGLTGMPKPSAHTIEQANTIGVYIDDMCASCLAKAMKDKMGIAESNKATREDIKNEIKISHIFITPSPIPGADDLGLVSGYCILGTGPLSSLLSAVTDTLGRKSGAYLTKAREAEAEALRMLKMQATDIGADAVANVRLNLTEASSGNGMLMVSAYGSAVKRQQAS